MSSAERKAAIVRCAFDLFSQKGFKGTTTRELAAAVGVSEPVLYQHFATKAELYTAIADHMLEKVTADFQESMSHLTNDDPPRKFLTALGERMLLWYMEETAHIRLLLFSALEGHELSEIWHKKATSEFNRIVGEYMAHQVRLGVFRGVDPAVAARAFMGLIGHYGLTSVIFQQPLPGVPKEEFLRECIEIFLTGLEKESV